MPLARPEDLVSFLEKTEALVHPEWGFPGGKLKSPGYHTKIPDGVVVHSTRSAAKYSLALLQSREAKWIARFPKVWETLLPLQETDPYQATFGIWPWFCEEPLPQMAPPDWNWADFIGAQLAQILRDHREQIPAELFGRLQEALRRAAWSIFRRNVQPGYTNIALMGAVVTAAAGELLGEPMLLDYARSRLTTFAEHTKHHGDFNEYNSPTYTIVAVEELDRMLYLVRDETLRRLAEELRHHAWSVVAEHFHAPTGSWAGPNSRTYGDHLNPVAKRFLAEYAGATFTEAKNETLQGLLEIEGLEADLFPRLPCPQSLRPRFQETFRRPIEIRKRFIRAADDAFSIYGTTFLTDAFALGSVSRDIFWTQRRPLIAHWKTGGQRPAVLRLRMLHDGMDFASGAIFTAQKENRILATAGVTRNRGDFHPSLDRPAEPIFTFRQFVLRFELTAADASGDLGPTGGSLRAADHCAWITPGVCEIDGKALAWRRGAGVNAETETNAAWIECVIWSGEPRAFDLRAMHRIRLAAALELLAKGEAPTRESIQIVDERARWADLAAPLLLEPDDIDRVV